MKVRAKFRVHSITETMGSVAAPTESDRYKRKQVPMKTIQMSPVFGNGDPKHENTKFWEASPCGSCELGTVNAEAAAAFKLDGEYYIDITPVGVEEEGVVEFEMPEGIDLGPGGPDFLRHFVHRKSSFKILVINGPKGSGKTRLAQALIKAMEANPADRHPYVQPRDEEGYSAVLSKAPGRCYYFDDCRGLVDSSVVRDAGSDRYMIFVGEDVEVFTDEGQSIILKLASPSNG